MRVVAIIPCRFESSRFPGKPIALIAGKPMMWHVYQKALNADVFDDVYIATDDIRIEEAATKLNLNVIKTKLYHSTGTDRVAEAAQSIDADYYVNIQGDEPLISLNIIKSIVKGIDKFDFNEVEALNAFTPLTNSNDITNKNVVKVITDVNQNALAFSRQAIPYAKKGKSKFYKQLGIYAFKASALRIFVNNSPKYLEITEEVEMYRLLEHGFKIKMIEVRDENHSISVDIPSDLDKVNKIFSNNKMNN
jgi:3-deoxy-manno-octulosonate cytidylyltransferase (CMP-KDO synthetase)